MNATVAFAATDLSALRLFTGASDARWAPAPLPEASPLPAEPAGASGEAAPIGAAAAPSAALAAYRQRATDAAQWTASRLDASRRLSLVCLDVSEILCLFLKSPSRTGPALAAAAQTAAQDWGRALPLGNVQGLWPLREQADTSDDPAESTGTTFTRLRNALNRSVGSRSAGGAISGVALSVPDALARIWLDELDARGVRADRVVTLWHALAQAWGAGEDSTGAPSDEITATILVEPDRRVVWAWSRAANLVAGGELALAKGSADVAPAVSRMSMDWLSWGAQLAGAPTRFVILAPQPDAWAKAIAERWPGASGAARVPTSDPIAQTLDRAANRSALDAAPSDPRRALVDLTRRPTRALRARFRWGAAALVLLSLALAGFSWRMQTAAREMRAVAASTSEDVRMRIQGLGDPALASVLNPVLALEAELTRLRSREPLRLPEAPKPVHAELARLLSALTQYPDARLHQIVMETRASQSCTLQLTLPDRRSEEELALKLEQARGNLNWSKRAGGSNRDPFVQFTGEWARAE